MKYPRVVLICVMFISAFTSTAAEIQPNKQYTGAVKLQSSAQGVTFELPKGWVGTLPVGGEFFVMHSQLFEGYMFGGIRQMTTAQAKQVMGQSINLGNGVILHPKSQVKVNDKVLTADYSVSGTVNPLAGKIKTIIGGYGWSVYFIAAAGVANSSQLQGALDKISLSLAFSDPNSAGASAQSSDVSPWYEHLVGRKLSRFYTQSGYTEEQYVWLCPDGGFFRSFNSGGFGGGASGAFESKYNGRWRVSGDLNQGLLELVYHDQTVTRYNLTHEGTKLFLDGKRWFREATNCQ